MLYSESRKNRQKGYYQLTAIFFVACLYLAASCQNNATQAEVASQQRLHLLEDSAQDAQTCLEHYLSISGDTILADRMARRYYQNEGEWLWMTAQDTTRMVSADSLANYLRRKAKEMGFSPDAFFADSIQNMLSHFQDLDFDSTGVSVSQTMASLELTVTKAYLRYAVGQRYGFMNPHKVLNFLDERKGGGYRIVYDIDLEQPVDHYEQEVLTHAAEEDPTTFLESCETRHPLYHRLMDKLSTDSTEEGRLRIICNMERLRWRHVRTPNSDERYIFVNIPSQQLWAISPDSVFSMRICCGAWKTKTPLLSSQIRLIQLNPEWNIPGSILRDEVSPHAGDSAYFARNHYFIIQRSTGDTVSAKNVTASQLRSGGYRVAQHSGPRNSLGRLIFRFNNQFDVYLHDTNNKSTFNNERRTVSHGCVRVQRPFDLAMFLLPQADEWLLDKIRMNIDMQPESDKGKKYKKEHAEDENPIAGIKMNSTGVSPNVPLFIDYYTLYPNPENDELEVWRDRYEYDIQIAKTIKPFLP